MSNRSAQNQYGFSRSTTENRKQQSANQNNNQQGLQRGTTIKKRKQQPTKFKKSAEILEIESMLDRDHLTVLENESIIFNSPQELMDRFDQLEESNVCLIKKNQETQEKCIGIVKQLRETCQSKQTKLEALKINKVFLTKKINSTIH